MEKPVHVKPSYYAYIFHDLKVIAKAYGYNLVLHGSLNRDLDLIAIPWVNDPKHHLDMVTTFSLHLNGRELNDEEKSLIGLLPGGRTSYVINLNRGGYRDDDSYVPDLQYYIDISVTPLPK